jgi:hypothetical protein
VLEPVQAEELEAEAAEVGGQQGEQPPVEAEGAADEDEEGRSDEWSLGEGESEEGVEYEDGDEDADDEGHIEEEEFFDDDYGERLDCCGVRALRREPRAGWRSRCRGCSLVGAGSHP